MYFGRGQFGSRLTVLSQEEKKLFTFGSGVWSSRPEVLSWCSCALFSETFEMHRLFFVDSCRLCFLALNLVYTYIFGGLSADGLFPTGLGLP